MKTVEKTVTRYLCEVCGSEYLNKDPAKKCEKKPLEKQEFFKGDIVEVIEPRNCLMKDSYYKVKKAVIEKVLQPECADEEYERKWLGGKKERLESHVRVYQVGWKCPRCKTWQSGRFYTPELKLISRKAMKRDKKRR